MSSEKNLYIDVIDRELRRLTKKSYYIKVEYDDDWAVSAFIIIYSTHIH